MSIKDATRRFSPRVENYTRYRPGYPPEIVGLLQVECGLSSQSIIADVAFGTGIFTRLLLENGNRVIGVEPNADMRHAGERFLKPYPGFTSVDGTAEATTLHGHSVDIVTAAQAAHWFDAEKATKEFRRIVKPRGWIVLLWNNRRADSTEFQRQYEQLLRTYGTDYEDVRLRGMTLAIKTFFSHSPFQVREFEYKQTFDYSGLEGRLLSSSYSPQPADPNYDLMLRDLRKLFHEHQIDGRISFDYDTRVHFGQVVE
jgi:ubiquinone/menaquinone biosynthesis C-methylase UbiE